MNRQIWCDPPEPGKLPTAGCDIETGERVEIQLHPAPDATTRDSARVRAMIRVEGSDDKPKGYFAWIEREGDTFDSENFVLDCEPAGGTRSALVAGVVREVVG